MFKYVLSILILGLVLIGCGEVVTPTVTSVKDVTAISGDSKVTVSWTISGDTSKIKDFKIVRDDGTGYKDLTTLNSKTARNYEDTTVEQGKTYKYGVAVIDSAGKTGTFVNQAGASIGPKPVAPVIVKSIKATSGDGQVTVSWVFEGDKAAISGFKVYRAAGSGSYLSVYTAPSTESSYIDTSVALGTKYKYGVAVIDKDGTEGARVNQAGAPVGPNPPIDGVNLTGKWQLVVTDTLQEPDKLLTVFLDLQQTGTVISGKVYNNEELEKQFGSVTGEVQSDGSLKLRVGFEDENPAPGGGHWNVTAIVASTGTTFLGTFEGWADDAETTALGNGPAEGTKVP